MTEDLTPSFGVKVPNGDNRERDVCNHCGFIDYKNPNIVAGAVVTQGDKILLCKRAIEPRSGFWTLPAGFMERGETVEEAAMREADEEACARIEIDRVLAIYTVARIGQVQIMYRAKLVSDIAPGPESTDVGLYDWADIPWSELAFPTVVWALTHFAATKHLTDFAPFTNPPSGDAIIR